MKKFTFVAIPGFVLALALSAMAQEKPITTNKEMKDTLKASVSGAVVLDYVWRSQEMTGFTASFSGGPAASDAENTFEGHLAIRMDVDLNDKVAAVVEFGTKRVDGGAILNWGNATANVIQLREARVVITDFLTQGLKFGVGLTDWSFDVRGKGQAFAFDPRHSQSFARNLSTNADPAGALGARAGAPEELESVGFWGSWSNQQVQLDVVLLPAALEGGSVGNDEALYAIDFWYHLDSVGKGSKIGAILAAVAYGPFTSTSVFTFGVGADLRMLDGNLELFAEVYFQFGDAGTNDGGGPIIPGVVNAGDTAKAKGIAFNLGAQYTIPNNPIWFGGTITYLSGDKDTTADKDVNNFLSYENVNDLMILEDMYLGFDWDTNYMAFKINGGFALSVGAGKENLRLSLMIGIARTNKDVQFAVANGGTTKKLGNELDLKAEWILTKQASLNFGVGFLFGSEVLENSMDTAGAVASKSEKNAILYTLGAMLKF
jgi:hypothetical protein